MSGRYEFIQPESFRPGQFLRGQRLCLHFDAARWLVDQIIRKTSQGKDDEDGFVRLKAKYFQEVMGRHIAGPVVDALLDGGAVLRSASYTPGERSYGYRLADGFIGDKHVRVPIADMRLAERIEAFHAHREQEQRSAFLPVHHALANWQHRLTIDSDRAQEILASLPAKSNPYDAQGVLVGAIERQEFAMVVGNYGRVFHNFTSMKRELRSALKVDGQHIGYVDLSCCQPSLIAFLHQRGIDPQQAVNLPQSIFRAEPQSLYDRHTLWPDSGVWAHYRKLCEDGELYDYLLERLARRGVTMTRDEMKHRFLTDIVAKKGDYDSDVEVLFQELFPEVGHWIQCVNSGGEDSHGNLIRLLQRVESRIVIETVVADLIRQYPEMYVGTLHDAVYAVPRQLPRVVDLFGQTFDRIGFRMGCKVKADAA